MPNDNDRNKNNNNDNTTDGNTEQYNDNDRNNDKRVRRNNGSLRQETQDTRFRLKSRKSVRKRRLRKHRPRKPFVVIVEIRVIRGKS